MAPRSQLNEGKDPLEYEKETVSHRNLLPRVERKVFCVHTETSHHNGHRGQESHYDHHLQLRWPVTIPHASKTSAGRYKETTLQWPKPQLCVFSEREDLIPRPDAKTSYIITYVTSGMTYNPRFGLLTPWRSTGLEYLPRGFGRR